MLHDCSSGIGMAMRDHWWVWHGRGLTKDCGGLAAGGGGRLGALFSLGGRERGREEGKKGE